MTLPFFFNDRYSCPLAQMSKWPKWLTVDRTRKLMSTWCVNKLQRKLLEALCNTLSNISCPVLLMAKCIKTNKDNIMSYKHETFFKLQHCFTTSGLQVLEKKWDSKKKLILHVVQKWELQQGITKYWPKFYCNHNIYMATRFMKMFSSSEHSHVINKNYKLNVYGLTDRHGRHTRQSSYFNE